MKPHEFNPLAVNLWDAYWKAYRYHRSAIVARQAGRKPRYNREKWEREMANTLACYHRVCRLVNRA